MKIFFRSLVERPFLYSLFMFASLFIIIILGIINSNTYKNFTTILYISLIKTSFWFLVITSLWFISAVLRYECNRNKNNKTKNILYHFLFYVLYIVIFFTLGLYGIINPEKEAHYPYGIVYPDINFVLSSIKEDMGLLILSLLLLIVFPLGLYQLVQVFWTRSIFRIDVQMPDKEDEEYVNNGAK